MKHKHTPTIAEHILSSVSGRGRHITIKALAYAIAAIDGLPTSMRELSDRDDMRRLLESMVPSDIELEALLAGVNAHLYSDEIQ